MKKYLELLGDVSDELLLIDVSSITAVRHNTKKNSYINCAGIDHGFAVNMPYRDLVNKLIELGVCEIVYTHAKG